VQEAEAKRLQVRANYFPQVSNESTLYNIIEKQRLTLPEGSLGTVPQLGAIPSSPTTIYQGGRSLLLAQTTVAQPLTQLLKIREGNAVAKTDVALAKTQSGRARVEIASKTKELYYALLGLEARKRASQASIVAAEERLKERKDETETGAILEVRAMQAKAALLESKQTGFTIDIQIDDFLAELCDLLGLSPDTKLALAPVGKIENVPALDEFVRKATEQNPELRSARQTVEKARRGVAAAKYDMVPDLGFFTQHIYQSGVPFFAPNNGVFGLRMNLTLFDWGKKSGVVKERQALLAQAEEESKRIERRMEIDVEKAYRRWQRVTGMAAVAREATIARKEALRIMKDQYELGLCAKAEYEEANAASLSMEADLATAEFQIMSAVADLNRLAGIL
jgi:outer membrane protein TolC